MDFLFSSLTYTGDAMEMQLLSLHTAPQDLLAVKP